MIDLILVLQWHSAVLRKIGEFLYLRLAQPCWGILHQSNNCSYSQFLLHVQTPSLISGSCTSCAGGMITPKRCTEIVHFLLALFRRKDPVLLYLSEAANNSRLTLYQARSTGAWT